MLLSPSRRGTLYGNRSAYRFSRLRSRRRLLATDATIPPSASGTLPPPPPPRKKRGAFSRLFLYSSFLTVGFYTGSTAVSLYSDEYRNFFVEHVPLGERIIDYTDSQGWDRAPVKTKVSHPLSGPTATERKLSETASEVKSKAGKKTGELKEAASQKAQSISKAASENYQKAKGKAKEVVDKAVTSTQEAINKKAETNNAVKTARNQAIKFSDGVEDLVNKAEEALKVAVADIVPTPSVPPLSEANAAEPGPAPEVNISKEDEEATPTKVYSGRLPIGFEPPPGYTLPRPKKTSKKTSSKRRSKASTSISTPEPAPLLAPQVAPFVSSEPIIGQLASTIDALTRLVEATPSASEKAGTQLERAKQDLTNLAQRIDTIKAEERSVLLAKLDDQTQEYNGKLRKLENQTQQKFDEQEKGWRDSFNQEQQKITEAYQKRLESELQTQSEIINRRLEEEVISQGVELQRRWIRDLKVKVEEEREGRLSKLEELTSSLKKLERLTLDNASYLEENLHLHALWSSLRSLTKVLDAPTRRPFREEIEILRNVTHNHQDAIVESTLLALEANSSPDIGVEPFADLASWFNTSVAPSLVSVALVPDGSAGVFSHLAAHLLSSLQFRRHGLVEGNDVLSVVARAEYYLNEKDLDNATRELNQLRGPSQVLLKDWLDAARRRLEVQQALQVIETRATMSSLLLL